MANYLLHFCLSDDSKAFAHCSQVLIAWNLLPCPVLNCEAIRASSSQVTRRGAIAGSSPCLAARASVRLPKTRSASVTSLGIYLLNSCRIFAVAIATSCDSRGEPLLPQAAFPSPHLYVVDIKLVITSFRSLPRMLAIVIFRLLFNSAHLSGGIAP